MRQLLIRMVAVCLALAGTTAWAGTVLVWGDSLSAGYGLRPEQAWPSLLAKRLGDSRSKHQVVNASISGETTAGGLSRLPAALQTHKPAVVVLELGANDGLRGLPPRAMAANLQSMIDAASKSGARVLLVGMRMPPNYGPAYTSAFEAAYRDLAKANKIRLVPFMMEGFADQRGMFQQDGIHPTAEAQPLILDTIWRELAPLLR